MRSILLILCLSVAAGCFAPDQVMPPGPGPAPVPVPDVVPATGIRILILFESESDYSRETLNILNSTAIYGRLNSICTKASDGRPEWRKWDRSTVDATGLQDESDIWRDLWSDTKPKLSATTLPVLVAVSDQKAVVYQLPATEAATLDLLQKIVEGK